MNHAESAYGLWTLVIINSAVFIMFAFSFFRPSTARDWVHLGPFRLLSLLYLSKCMVFL